jgi:hypothetical protein
VQGFQGTDLAATNTILCQTFCRYGFAESGRDYNTVDGETTPEYYISSL